jgi:hypothetical protein
VFLALSAKGMDVFVLALPRLALPTMYARNKSLFSTHCIQTRWSCVFTPYTAIRFEVHEWAALIH